MELTRVLAVRRFANTTHGDALLTAVDVEVRERSAHEAQVVIDLVVQGQVSEYAIALVVLYVLVTLPERVVEVVRRGIRWAVAVPRTLRSIGVDVVAQTVHVQLAVEPLRELRHHRLTVSSQWTALAFLLNVVG